MQKPTSPALDEALELVWGPALCPPRCSVVLVEEQVKREGPPGFRETPRERDHAETFISTGTSRICPLPSYRPTLAGGPRVT